MDESRLHLVSGETLNVAESAESAARKLWPPDTAVRAAGEPSYVTMESDGRAVRLNPDTVMYVEERPVYGGAVR